MAERTPNTANRGSAAPTPVPRSPVPRGPVRRSAPLRDGRGDASAWLVTDDFPHPIPVGAAEIAVLETYLGVALDALFRELQ
jgi:hypothetical protein